MVVQYMQPQMANLDEAFPFFIKSTSGFPMVFQTKYTNVGEREQK